VECFLNTNINWSNGEIITLQDILKTYEILKSTKINPNMNDLLKKTTFKLTDTSIIFKNTEKDINFLKIFFQPVVSEKILNIISKKEREGSFSLQNGIYSGKYKISNITKDEIQNITTLILEKNESYYNNNVYIENIFIKIFPNIDTFLKNKSSVNVFNDTNNLIT
jgi:hypothetical protein